ncbi:restriction endonuclease subunit S [Pseudomonas serboccidentalis]|uniref:restriction endonuclease subunit S n=1 Tax=Pseudomonas serboccidentalis TaxID=2964670 RepID=UPI0039E19E48
MVSNNGFMPLRELSVRITKGTTPTKGQGFVSQGINYIKSESITPVGTIDKSKFAFIDERTHAALERSQLRAGNILFSMAGVYLGKTAVVQQEHLPANTNQAVGIISLDESKADPYFIHYALQSPECRGWVARSASQSAQPNFNLKEIGDLPIPKFSLPVQKQISESLRTLDSKIALSRRINRTLEAMAQAIFKSWFVDFDPVRAKITAIAEGRDPLRAAMSAISGKPDAELDALLPEQYEQLAATAALFPDEMEESELVETPKGWVSGALGDICSFTAGSAFKPEHQGSTEGDYPFIKVSDMNLAGNEVFIQSANNYVSKDQQSEMKVKLHPPGATVFAKIGVALTSNRRRLLTTPTIIDNNLMSVSPIEGKSGWYFLYSTLSTIDFNILVSGTALPYVNVSDLKKIPIVRPPHEVVLAFEATVSSMFSMMLTLAAQRSTLTATRNTLLPKLLSGEVEVPEMLGG